MEKPPMFAPSTLLAAGVAWTLTLAFGEPTIGITAAAVAAVDLMVVTLTCVVGLVLARARWARRLALADLGLMAAMAMTMPISNNWIIALILSGLALVAVTGPSLDRHLPSPPPGAPPGRAVALPLLLLAFPALVAFATGSPIPTAAWILIVIAPIVAWAYGKAWLSGLWAARLAVPAATVAVLWTLEPWPFAALGLALAVAVWLAWSRDAARAVQPPVAGARFVQVPPELAPRDVLSTAGLDARGKPLAGGAAASEEGP